MPAHPGEGVSAVPERTAIRKEYQEIIHGLFEKGDGFHYLEEPGVADNIERCWQLIQRWSIRYLNDHPVASAEELANELLQLNPEQVLDTSDHRAETFRLWGNAVQLRSVSPRLYVQAANFDRIGTFFVLQQKEDGTYEVAWDIKPIAKEHYSKRDQLGYWAHDKSAIGDGPLVARAHSLPPTTSGNARFYIAAESRPFMGGTHASQLSVWEWTGDEAVAKVIDCYSETYESGEPSFDGVYLRIPMKGHLKNMTSCGMCIDPRVTWTVEVTPNAVVDRGREFRDWVLEPVDDAITAALNSGASRFAEPELIADLRNHLVSESGEPCDLFSTWSVEGGDSRAAVVLPWCVPGGALKIWATRQQEIVRVVKIQHEAMPTPSH